MCSSIQGPRSKCNAQWTFFNLVPSTWGLFTLTWSLLVIGMPPTKHLTCIAVVVVPEEIMAPENWPNLLCMSIILRADVLGFLRRETRFDKAPVRVNALMLVKLLTKGCLVKFGDWPQAVTYWAQPSLLRNRGRFSSTDSCLAVTGWRLKGNRNCTLSKKRSWPREMYFFLLLGMHEFFPSTFMIACLKRWLVSMQIVEYQRDSAAASGYWVFIQWLLVHIMTIDADLLDASVPIAIAFQLCCTTLILRDLPDK